MCIRDRLCSPGSSSTPSSIVDFRFSITSPAVWMIIHFAPGTRFFHRRLELRMNHRIFVFILDLIAAFLHALVDVSLAAGFRFVTAPTNGEKEHRLGAPVKMLMEPHLRRHKDAARAPLDSLHGLAFLPH